jgi:hypothetical protein
MRRDSAAGRDRPSPALRPIFSNLTVTDAPIGVRDIAVDALGFPFSRCPTMRVYDISDKAPADTRSRSAVLTRFEIGLRHWLRTRAISCRLMQSRVPRTVAQFVIEILRSLHRMRQLCAQKSR